VKRLELLYLRGAKLPFFGRQVPGELALALQDEALLQLPLKERVLGVLLIVLGRLPRLQSHAFLARGALLGGVAVLQVLKGTVSGHLARGLKGVESLEEALVEQVRLDHPVDLAAGHVRCQDLLDYGVSLFGYVLFKFELELDLPEVDLDLLLGTLHSERRPQVAALHILTGIPLQLAQRKVPLNSPFLV